MLQAVFLIVIVFAVAPARLMAGECPTAASDIATDRPDVTNSSLVVPLGSLQNENGINTTGRGREKTFDGTNSRWRLGIAPCLEILVDLPSYVGRIKGDPATGFSNAAPAIKWQLNSLPAAWNLSVVAGAGLPTGTARIAGLGIQPYLQFPWSYELGSGWGTSGMLTSFFTPADVFHQQMTEATFVLEKKVTERTSLFVEYVGDYPNRGSSVQSINSGGVYLLTKTQQIDFHIAFGLNRNSPDYIVGFGYSIRLDGFSSTTAR